MKTSAARTGRSAKIATRLVPPSLLPNCRSRAGTSRSAIPPSPMASWTVWFTTPTASKCVASPCARNAIRHRTRRRNEPKPVSVRCLSYGTNFPEEDFWTTSGPHPDSKRAAYRHSAYGRHGGAVTVPQFTSLPGFPPAFRSAQSFSASDLTFNEMESMSENDFECFTSMGVKSPLKAMFLMQIGIIADLGIAPRNARRSSASMVSLLEEDFWPGIDSGLIGIQFSMSVIAFYEKAGRCQVGSFVFSLDKGFLPPSRHCRHPSIRTLG